VPTPAALAIYWFAMLAALGTFFPLYSLYLSENLGFSGFQTGLVTAAIPLAGMLAQPLWGTFADRSGSRVRVLAFVTGAAAGGYFFISTQRTFAGVLAATVALALFSTSVMPMSVAVSLGMLRERGRHAFGMVRSAGTLGYLVAVASFPILVHSIGGSAASIQSAEGSATEPRLGFMLVVAACWMGLASLLALTLPRKGAVALRAGAGDWRQLVSSGPYVRLLAVTFFTYVFLQGPLVMFPMFVRSLGGDLETVSRMWVWMLAFEIPLLAGVAAAPERIGARELIGIGIAADAFRWLVCSLVSDLQVIYVVQVFHGLAVAGFVVGSALYVEAVVPGRLRSTAQGLLYMAGVSLGGIVSSITSGALIDAFGPTAPGIVGGAGGALLAIALPWILPAVSRHTHDEMVAIEAVDERPTA
jgi:MFS transporter, PPP family, 3-phenylpropionic acid transporter